MKRGQERRRTAGEEDGQKRVRKSEREREGRREGGKEVDGERGTGRGNSLTSQQAYKYKRKELK